MDFHEMSNPVFWKQNAHVPQFAHLIKTAIAYLQIPCNFFSIATNLTFPKKMFLSVLPYMGMADILLNGADPFEQIVNIPLTERRPYVNHVKSSENCFKEDIKRFYNFIHVYSPRTKGPRSPPLQNFDSSYSFITLIIHCKFHQLVFIIHWENDFLTFFPYKCMGHKFFLAVKRSKVNLRTLFEKLSRPWVIWTKLVDLEFPMLYTKIQLQSFLVLEKKIF